MPHAHLAPLGRQLRPVLASLHLSPWPTHLPQASIALQRRASLYDAPLHGKRRNLSHVGQRRTLAATAIVDDGEVSSDQRPVIEDGKQFRTHSWRRLKRRARVDHLNDALRKLSKTAAMSKSHAHKPDLSHFDVYSGRRVHPRHTRNKRAAQDSPALSLQRILGSYLRSAADPNLSDALSIPLLEPEDPAPIFVLNRQEAAYLRFRGYSMSDVMVWANIVGTDDSFEASQLLSRHAATLGMQSIPMFVLMHVLRREYISARALRSLLDYTATLFAHRRHTLEDSGPDRAPLVLASIRLLRHARELWPAAMDSIVDMVLQHLASRKRNTDSMPSTFLPNITFLLNKMMKLISLSTSIHPFKDEHHQEIALVRILRYMAEHDPPLHIQREGYRAVVRLQMLQKKTRPEQQWAELKALSWPPWKVDRTAMDASIDLEYGVTKAGNTLRRMREAGYAHRQWEKVAQIYTGWDTDMTPTIQLRAIFRSSSYSYLYDRSAVWVARIQTTRTIQEAWACYLAWEDEKLPHNQQVYLAIFERLNLEARRIQTQARSDRSARRASSDWGGFPGDRKEMEPLPPSTHLYTYTRTRPPTVEELYSQLHSRQVVFEDYCLAFLVSNAKTLQSGVEYLRHSFSRYPALRGLLSLDRSCDLSSLPTPVFAAAIELLSRFGKVPFSNAVPHQSSHLSMPETADHFLDNYTLNHNSCIVRALILLQRRRTTHRPAWNSALRGLTRDAVFLGLRTALNDRDMLFTRDMSSKPPSDVERCLGAILAYRLVRRTLSLLSEIHIDLDATGFQHLCHATENMTVAAWRFLEMDAVGSVEDAIRQDPLYKALSKDVKQMIRRSSHSTRLTSEFWTLVGEGDSGPSQSTLGASTGLPQLLTVPGPAILHAHIRALGWMGDYEGIRTLIDWMCKRHVELDERANQDRQGKHMMRKVFVAARVFLERSWLIVDDEKEQTANYASADPAATGHDGSEENIQIPVGGSVQWQRLRMPANEELVDAVRGAVDSVQTWEGWPSDEEVELYCADRSFAPFTAVRMHR